MWVSRGNSSRMTGIACQWPTLGFSEIAKCHLQALITIDAMKNWIRYIVSHIHNYKAKVRIWLYLPRVAESSKNKNQAYIHKAHQSIKMEKSAMKCNKMHAYESSCWLLHCIITSKPNITFFDIFSSLQGLWPFNIKKVPKNIISDSLKTIWFWRFLNLRRT